MFVFVKKLIKTWVRQKWIDLRRKSHNYIYVPIQSSTAFYLRQQFIIGCLSKKDKDTLSFKLYHHSNVIKQKSTAGCSSVFKSTYTKNTGVWGPGIAFRCILQSTAICQCSSCTVTCLPIPLYLSFQTKTDIAIIGTII